MTQEIEEYRYDKELEDMHRSVSDIRETVHKLEETKQDKIKLVVIIPLIIYLLSQLGVWIWWASNISTSVDGISNKVEDIADTIFTVKDAESFKESVDLKIENLRLEMYLDKQLEKNNVKVK